MLLTLALAVLPAVAGEVAAPSEPPEPAFFPAAGATLPANGRLFVVGAERVLVTHADGSVEDLAVGEPFVSADIGTWGAIAPTMVDGDVITVETVCGAPCGTSAEQSWAVGPADDAAPTIQWGTSTVGPLLIPSEPASVHVFGDELDEVHLGTVTVSGVWQRVEEHLDFTGTNERTVCLDAIATDLAGNESAVESMCNTVAARNPLEQFISCASTGGANTALFALTALLLRRRRR
jgi:hypothetical protein